jgi:drug/metabolite transporter (DMT)-like permease
MKPQTDEATAERRRERLIGILLVCSAFLCFSGLDATAKWVNHAIPSAQTVWARYMSNVILVTAVLNPVARPGVLRTSRPRLQAIRSLLLFGSTLLNFTALRYLQLAETTAISFATPLLVALLAAPILGERIGPHRMAAILVGFVGVLVVVRPGLGALHPAALLSIAGCFCYAFYAISTRILAQNDRAETTLFYSGIAGILVLTPILPFFWVTPTDPWVWVGMGAMGAFAGFGHYLVILAHGKAPAAILAPFVYTQLLWMVTLGYVVFGDVPDRWTVAGALVVCASGLYLIHRERR